MTGYALGIDVGSTRTAAATWRDGHLDVVTLTEHAHAMPSVVYLRDDGTLLVGQPALRRSTTDPTRIATDFKRDLGSDVPRMLDGTAVGTEDLFAALIRHVVETVREREGAAADHVTLTCPAGWGEWRRDRLRTAAQRAGLDEVGLLDEPVAAATHYASLARRGLAPGTLLAVYDLGGATFDVAVVRKTVDAFELCGRPGGAAVGGVDFDDIVLGHVRSAVGPSWPSEMDEATLLAMSRLRVDVAERKEALSADIEVAVPVLLPGASRQVRLTRREFEEAITPLLAQTVLAFSNVLTGAGIDPRSLDRILLVGGGSRMPLVTQLLGEAMPSVPTNLDEHPKWATCLGAAIAAGVRVQPEPRVAAPSALVAPQPIEQPPLAAPPTRPVAQSPRPVARPRPEPRAPAVAPHLPIASPPSYDVDLTATGLTGLMDVPLRPAVDLRPRRTAALGPQVAAELGPAEEATNKWRPAVSIAVIVLLALAVLALIVVGASR